MIPAVRTHDPRELANLALFDIPNDAGSTSIDVEVDWDSDNGHDQIKVSGSSNATTLTYDTGPYLGWFSNLRIELDNLMPTRNPAYLVAPSDYSGLYIAKDFRDEGHGNERT